MYDLKCDLCGKFIGLDEFDNGTARRKLVQPDNEFGGEEYETYHMECFEAAFGLCTYPDWEGKMIVGKHSLDKDGFCNICGEKFYI